MLYPLRGAAKALAHYWYIATDDFTPLTWR